MRTAIKAKTAAKILTKTGIIARVIISVIT
jgi:hypothetical protein